MIEHHQVHIKPHSPEGGMYQLEEGKEHTKLIAQRFSIDSTEFEEGLSVILFKSRTRD